VVTVASVCTATVNRVVVSTVGEAEARAVMRLWPGKPSSAGMAVSVEAVMSATAVVCTTAVSRMLTDDCSRRRSVICSSVKVVPVGYAAFTASTASDGMMVVD